MGGTGVDPRSCKMGTFLLGPWLLVCQFIEISNQMELTCEVSSFEYKNLYNALCAMEFAEPTRNFGNGGASKLSYLQMC